MIHRMSGPTISRDELADFAARAFIDAEMDDMPSKLWIDTAEALEQSYLRACWDRPVTGKCLARIALLASAIDAKYGTELVCCAYGFDRDWAEIEAAAKSLKAVR